MKPTAFLLLLFATLAFSEYPRMKYRGPPPYPKPPPYHQISKKWQQHPPPRPPLRPRQPNQQPPFPNHNQQPSFPNHNQQPSFPNHIQQLSFPNHNNHNQQPPFPNPTHPRPSIPVHMPNHHKIQMGVAASVNRPVSVPVRAFWKNTQTTFRTPTVDQHYVTSAPVLPKKVFQSSPAILAQEYDFQIQSNNIPTPIKTIKQIGEKGPIHTIPAPNLSLADKPIVVEEVKPKQQNLIEEVQHQVQQIQRQQPEVATYVQIQKAHQYQVTEAPELSKQTLYQSQNLNSLQPHELYQLMSAYQQPAAIILQDPQDYLQQPQNYVDQIPQEQFAALDKSFEESSNSRKDSASLVTAAYNLEPEGSESVVHSQYVQNYFGGEPTPNHVEPDAKPSEKNNTPSEGGYYVSLPNKEAAESLANLQAAGKLNNKLMQRGKSGEPVSIYVPDDEEARDETNQSEEEEEPSYDDYAQEEEEEMRGGDETFGQRYQPKNNNRK